ncbi:MAG: ATP-binding protein [Janibacter sp.]|nr:ATP-binding protein [Janibacter sp.]
MLADASRRGRPGARDLVLTGNRGVGKTVMMKRCAEIAETRGYLQLSFQASGHATLSAALLEAVSGHPRRSPSWAGALESLTRITGASLGVAGVSASISRAPASQARPDPYNTTAIANAVADLARMFRGEGSGGVILCIDELQMTAGADVEALGGVLNHLNNWHAAEPVVFVATGLPNTLAKMMGPDPGHPLISNPSRLFTFEPLEQYLSLEDTTKALRPLARDHGADWTEEAVEELYRITHGYPAHVQILAAATWSTSSPPTIYVEDVHRATPTAQAEVNRMYLLPRWEQMGNVQRAYMTAMSMCDSPAESGRVAAMLGRSTTDVSRTREALIRAGDIYASGTGSLSLAQPLMRYFAPRHYHATVEGTPDLPTLREMSSARDEWVDKRRRPPEELTADEIQHLATPPGHGRRLEQRRPPGGGDPRGPAH